jgi:hypothetical protein
LHVLSMPAMSSSTTSNSITKGKGGRLQPLRNPAAVSARLYIPRASQEILLLSTSQVNTHVMTSMCNYTHYLPGNAVSVRGPLTTLSTPMTIVVDGNIKSVGPPVQGSDGCGTFFTETDLDGTQGHVLTMVFAAASGSVRFGISGITYVFPSFAFLSGAGLGPDGKLVDICTFLSLTMVVQTIQAATLP